METHTNFHGADRVTATVHTSNGHWWVSIEMRTADGAISTISLHARDEEHARAMADGLAGAAIDRGLAVAGGLGSAAVRPARMSAAEIDEAASSYISGYTPYEIRKTAENGPSEEEDARLGDEYGVNADDIAMRIIALCNDESDRAVSHTDQQAQQRC